MPRELEEVAATVGRETFRASSMMKGQYTQLPPNGYTGELKVSPAIDPNVVDTVQELLNRLRSERISVEEKFCQLSQELDSILLTDNPHRGSSEATASPRPREDTWHESGSGKAPGVSNWRQRPTEWGAPLRPISAPPFAPTSKYFTYLLEGSLVHLPSSSVMQISLPTTPMHSRGCLSVLFLSLWTISSVALDWPFSVVLVITSILAVFASSTFLIPLLPRISREQLSGKVTEFCLTHLNTNAPANCSACFPSSRSLDTPVIVDENTTRPTPIFSPHGLAYGQIHLVSPAALLAVVPDATVSCFLFQGEKAHVHVRMESPTSNLTGISFDYSSIRSLLDPVYIPREVSVWGLYRGPMNSPEIEQHLLSLPAGTAIRPGPGGSSYILITRGFINPLSVACMAIAFPEPLLSSQFEALAVQVLSNWGGDRTCLAPFLFYRRHLEDDLDTLLSETCMTLMTRYMRLG
ncbi:hypothetical protein BDM02DRAFT_3132789 [Thelephora ganbajun]|uniref:Uncharacterized protein n=1 Tax=Thelephora ganbajun TaxID=370292 RepID=A0ACB6YZM4_THEGA|nr:hypothetical protein BDM02DRAFT_3132789 [Thelephora ganbajun]